MAVFLDGLWVLCAELGGKVLPHLIVSFTPGNLEVVFSSHRG